MFRRLLFAVIGGWVFVISAVAVPGLQEIAEGRTKAVLWSVGAAATFVVVGIIEAATRRRREVADSMPASMLPTPGHNTTLLLAAAFSIPAGLVTWEWLALDTADVHYQCPSGDVGTATCYAGESANRFIALLLIVIVVAFVALSVRSRRRYEDAVDEAERVWLEGAQGTALLVDVERVESRDHHDNSLRYHDRCTFELDLPDRPSPLTLERIYTSGSEAGEVGDRRIARYDPAKPEEARILREEPPAPAATSAGA